MKKYKTITQDQMRQAVVDYFNGNCDRSDNFKLKLEDVFVVWFCKTLQNAKAMISTTVSDGMYYELTYNGDKDELYLDAYKKWENKHIKISTDKPGLNQGHQQVLREGM